MPTKKIADIEDFFQKYENKTCHHSDHNPPSHQVFEPGVYEHTCPKCNHTVTFTVQPSHLCTSRN